ncbi:MAG TPA: inositol monophosphatase family protein [Candidatus Dormibacteraeota bacterium]|nr:inositol monophosphatase family protein [Candidatus Dormibacteraeota bacterium]
MSNFKDIAIQAARQAGDYTLEFLDKDVVYSMKTAHDIQAEADVGSEQIIIKTIKSAFPDHSIFAEESGHEDQRSDYLWIIDPIDGTINFSRHIEEYCVSIALSHKDKIILAVLYAPAMQQLIIAEAGKGAYLNDRKITVSSENKLINCLVATDNSSNIEGRKRNLAALGVFAPEVRHVRVLGSAAWCMGRIAQGQIDLYYKYAFNYYDYAAGILIVQEAGGTVTDMDGHPITINSQNIVATNGAMHQETLDFIKSCQT